MASGMCCRRSGKGEVTSRGLNCFGAPESLQNYLGAPKQGCFGGDDLDQAESGSLWIILTLNQAEFHQLTQPSDYTSLGIAGYSMIKPDNSWGDMMSLLLPPPQT